MEWDGMGWDEGATACEDVSDRKRGTGLSRSKSSVAKRKEPDQQDFELTRNSAITQDRERRIRE
jgi:hypothetical protein